MTKGVIIRSLSGFYTVSANGEEVMCKARGRFRHDRTTPLVGDRVMVAYDEKGNARVDAILPRKNRFIRPAVANIDQLVMFASAVNPVTDPFLIDRVCTIAELNDCEPVVCINKCDLDSADHLTQIYTDAGFQVIRTSAETGEGLDALRSVISGKVNAFTGNSGVGKSSILNRLCPELKLATGEVSEKLGRGRHTTRSVAMYDLGDETYVADTPGFASFEVDLIEPIRCEELQYAFRDFRPYLGQCRFQDCAHLKEPGCAVLSAVSSGRISTVRHQSYARLYENAKSIPEWQKK